MINWPPNQLGVAMKLIIAFVKPYTLDDVRDALEDAGVMLVHR